MKSNDPVSLFLCQLRFTHIFLFCCKLASFNLSIFLRTLICFMQCFFSSFQHESAAYPVSSATRMQHQFDENVHSVLNSLKLVLAKMRSLHTVCSYLEQARGDESEKNDDFVTSTSMPDDCSSIGATFWHPVGTQLSTFTLVSSRLYGPL